MGHRGHAGSARGWRESKENSKTAPSARPADPRKNGRRAGRVRHNRAGNASPYSRAWRWQQGRSRTGPAASGKGGWEDPRSGCDVAWRSSQCWCRRRQQLGIFPESHKDLRTLREDAHPSHEHSPFNQQRTTMKTISTLVVAVATLSFSGLAAAQFAKPDDAIKYRKN